VGARERKKERKKERKQERCAFSGHKERTKGRRNKKEKKKYVQSAMGRRDVMYVFLHMEFEIWSFLWVSFVGLFCRALSILVVCFGM